MNKEDDMAATQLDPRTIADALEIDTFDLGHLLRKWAAQQLTFAADDLTGNRSDFVDYDRITKFEERVDAARRQLVAAVEAEKAYQEDNPADESDET